MDDDDKFRMKKKAAGALLKVKLLVAVGWLNLDYHDYNDFDNDNDNYIENFQFKDLDQELGALEDNLDRSKSHRKHWNRILDKVKLDPIFVCNVDQYHQYSLCVHARVFWLVNWILVLWGIHM